MPHEAFYLRIAALTPLAGAAGSHQVIENTCLVTNIYEIKVRGERAWVWKHTELPFLICFLINIVLGLGGSGKEVAPGALVRLRWQQDTS